MNYGEIIKAAFWITLRNRFLWFFGFFAGGTMAGANFNILPGNFGDFDGEDFGDPGRGGSGGMTPTPGLDPSRWVLDNLALILVVAAVVVLIVLLFMIMSLISQGALAESVAALDRGENRRFSSAFSAGVSKFWHVLGYFLLLVLISLGLLLVIGIPLALLVTVVFATMEAPGARILTVVLAALAGFVFLLAVFVPLIIVWQFGLRKIVVHQEGVVGSIGSGYWLFRRNLGKSLLLLVIQIAISIGAGLALLIATLLLGLLLAAPALILFAAALNTAGIVAGIVAGLILLPLLLVASGALGAFNHSYWTLAYLRITGVPGGHLPQSGEGP
jgi:hypothetical protein